MLISSLKARGQVRRLGFDYAISGQQLRKQRESAKARSIPTRKGSISSKSNTEPLTERDWRTESRTKGSRRMISEIEQSKAEQKIFGESRRKSQETELEIVKSCVEFADDGIAETEEIWGELSGDR